MLASSRTTIFREEVTAALLVCIGGALVGSARWSPLSTMMETLLECLDGQVQAISKQERSS